MGFMALASDQLQHVASFVSLRLFFYPCPFPLWSLTTASSYYTLSIRNALVLAAHMCQMNKI